LRLSIGVRLELPVFEAYGRPPDAGPASAIELLLDDRAGDEWIYRRDPAVRRPLKLAQRRGPAGIQLLAPEIVLLPRRRERRTSTTSLWRSS
jgi:hypothetical protein